MSLSIESQDVTADDYRNRVYTWAQHGEPLPTLPNVMQPVVRLLDDLNSSLDEIEEAISHDLSCTARLLQIANSAFYSPSRPITSIRRAILLLGFNTTKRIALNLSVFNGGAARDAKHIATITALWQHSHAVATLSRRIAYDVPTVDAELALCTGLLHDLGRVVLLHLFPDVYQQCLAEIGGSHANLIQLEREHFGITHVEAGQWLAESWQLPMPIQRTLAHHHYVSTLHPLAMMVMLADHIVTTQQIGLADAPLETINPSRLARGLSLTAKHLKQYSLYIQGYGVRRQPRSPVQRVI